MLSTFTLLGLITYFLLAGAALFGKEIWLKWLLLAVSALLAMVFIAGDLSRGLGYSICFSTAGFIMVIAFLALLLGLGHDIQHRQSGI